MTDINKLKLGREIYRPAYKTDNAATFEATYDGRAVIVKRGDERLRREERILQAVTGVTDNGIPKFVAYLIDAQHNHLLVMERLPGQPLSDLIELSETWHSRPLLAAEARRITGGLAACFAVFHRAGYLYRDLNLGHILVDNASIGLVDCEWSVPIDRTTGQARVDARGGTWQTMAPEEFDVGDTMTAASNTYTLGIVLLQLLSGRNPFYITKETTADADRRRDETKTLHEALPAIKTGDSDLDQIITRALQPDPVKRFQSIDEFRAALSKR